MYLGRCGGALEYLHDEHALTLYYSFIYPYMIYCNNVWGSIYKSNTERNTYSPKTTMRIMFTWWRHQMETFSALLTICAGNSPASGEFPPQRPVTRSFDVFFDLCLNKRLRKLSWGWWFETLTRPLWRHRNDFWKRESVIPVFINVYRASPVTSQRTGKAELWCLISCQPEQTA